MMALHYLLTLALFGRVLQSASTSIKSIGNGGSIDDSNDIFNATVEDILPKDGLFDDDLIVPNSIYAVPEASLERTNEDTAPIETTTLKTATTSTARGVSLHARPSPSNVIVQSNREDQTRPFNSVLPLAELIVLGCCLIFGIIANCLFVLVLRSDDPIARRKNWENLPSSFASVTAKNAHFTYQSMAFPSTRVYLESSFILDTLTLIFLAFSVFPFHSPFFSDYPFLHLVLSMTSFSLLDVILLAAAWTAVALAFDQLRRCRATRWGDNVRSLSFSPAAEIASEKSAILVVILISSLSFLLSIPSFILFQHHLRTAIAFENGSGGKSFKSINDPSVKLGSDGMVIGHFEHSQYLESHYQIWSKFSLRYWLPLILTALFTCVALILLKRRRYVSKMTSLTSATEDFVDHQKQIDDRVRVTGDDVQSPSPSDDGQNSVQFVPQQSPQHHQHPQQQPLLTSQTGYSMDQIPEDERIFGFVQICVVKLIVFLLLALPHFVLTTILYLDSGHLDSFDVLRSTAFTSLINGGGPDKAEPELSMSQCIVCLTSILLSLYSVASFFVFLCGSKIVRMHFKRVFKKWCHGPD